MVYSTCTQEPEENEAVVSHLLNLYENVELQDIKLKINRSKAITKFGNLKINPEVKKCLRIYPQDNDTEGFFVAGSTLGGPRSGGTVNVTGQRHCFEWSGAAPGAPGPARRPARGRRAG